jgi:septum formation protein
MLDAPLGSVYVFPMPFRTRDLPPVILASGSPRRAALLRQLGLDFKVLPSQAAEIHCAQLTALEVSQINACRKARSVAEKHSDALVLGADTLVFLDTALYGKPPDLEAAYRMLEELQGRTHHVVTAICLLHLRERRQRVFAETTAVTFRPLDALKIRRYLARVNPLDKAGAYAIQEAGGLIIEKISGSYSNVVGLPVERLEQELTRWVKGSDSAPPGTRRPRWCSHRRRHW